MDHNNLLSVKQICHNIGHSYSAVYKVLSDETYGFKPIYFGKSKYYPKEDSFKVKKIIGDNIKKKIIIFLIESLIHKVILILQIIHHKL